MPWEDALPENREINDVTKPVGKLSLLEEAMTIEKTINGNTAELKLAGWLDTKTAPELEAALNELEPGVDTLVLDLEQLEYISSAGLRQIVAAYKYMKGALTIRHVSSEIRNVLKMTGLDKRLKIEEEKRTGM